MAPLSRRPDHDLARLLKALKRSAGPARPGEDGSIRVVVEAGGIRRAIAFRAEILAGARSAGLVEDRDGGVALGAAGLAWLRREGQPEAPFLAQHRPLERRSMDHPDGASDVLVDQAESPLAWLARRRGKDGRTLVSEAAFMAGERLRADYTRANLLPRVTANWQSTVSSGRRGEGSGLDYSDVVMAARQRVDAAVRAVGPELGGVLVDVCCFLAGIEQVECDRGWPARSGKVVLCLALDRLAAHYGISTVATGVRAGMTSWGADGYRPSFLRPKKAGVSPS